MATTGKNIKKYRIRMNMTQQRLAELCKVRVGAVSKWERDQNAPSDISLHRLTEIFDVPECSLVGDMS